MKLALAAPVLLAVFTVACSCAPEEPAANEPNAQASPTDGGDSATTSPLTMDYEGPAILATLDSTDDGGDAVTVEVETPTLSWQLEPVGARVVDGVTTVELKLTEPAADELVGQMMTTLRQQVPLTEPPAGDVHVRVSRWQRGVRYLIAPEAKLAAIVSAR